MPYSSKEKLAAYAKFHYNKNKAVYVKRAAAYTALQREGLWKHIIGHLSSNPCARCGEADIVVLDFDHLPGFIKKFNVSRAPNRGRSLSSLEAEIKKCQVLCSNCHRRETYKRAGWTRKL